ncbi:MAG TPA: DUF3500 domain-containing protein [Dehalococcoidia bacterium]|nr:DUF3500 domain-containing protein [Dehalococcoidia bacterium]
MTATGQYYGLGIRKRPVSPARYLSPEAAERFKPRIEAAERAIAEPFRGITADGNVIPNLFPIRATGVSTRPLVDAAKAFLASLDGAQRQAVAFPIDSDAWRRWYNIHPFVMRHGILLETLTEPQREAAMGLLRSTLSADGHQLAVDIMRLNHTIGELTGSWDEYGEWVYFLSIFGEPTEDEPWGWQIDGHHLIVNCFVLGDQVVVTPMFMGSEPVIAETGKYAGTAVLQAEQDEGLRFIRSLNPDQQAQAILYPSIRSDTLPPERGRGPDGRIRGAAFSDNLVLPYEGLLAAGLSPAQKDGLLRLVSIYTGRLRDGHAGVWQADIERHLDETHFLWMGGTEDDSVFYYRIHSPVILIEFDHQSGVAFDNEEPMRSHIHTVIRTPNGNDYGKDLLRQHYARFEHVGGVHVARTPA